MDTLAILLAAALFGAIIGYGYVKLRDARLEAEQLAELDRVGIDDLRAEHKRNMLRWAVRFGTATKENKQ